MTSALHLQTRKEVRALLPWAIGVALTTVALSRFANANAGFPNFRFEQQGWLVLVHAAGVLAIAAMSLGQELTHGTFPALLVQPIDRRRVLWTKLAVLAGVVIALGLLADLAFADWRFARAGRTTRTFLIWGPPIVGIGLVPLLTLLSRKPLGGAVFAVAIPGLILVVAQRLFPYEPQAIAVAWDVTLIACACGLAALVYVFPRAEVAGDHQSPRRSSAAPASPTAARTAPAPRHWAWFAVWNELRLQQLTLAVSGLFVLLGAAIVILQRMDPPYAGPGIGALAAIHGIVIAIIAGSRASAEERQLGVIAAQALRPKPAWQPWVIKVLVTVGLALTLSVVLPWLFRFVDADSTTYVTEYSRNSLHPARNWFGLESEYFVGVVVAAAGALYVSTLSSNSLWALLACLPTAGGVLLGAMAVEPVIQALRQAYWAQVNSAITPEMLRHPRDASWRVYLENISRIENVQVYLSLGLIVSFSLFVLYLAHRNHRTLERGTSRIALQAGLMWVFGVVATATYFGVSQLAWSIIR